MEKEKKCESDGMTYTSNPPQNKCKNCIQLWVIGKEVPVCKKGEWQQLGFSLNEYELWKIYGTDKEFKLPIKLLKRIRKSNSNKEFRLPVKLLKKIRLK